MISYKGLELVKRSKGSDDGPEPDAAIQGPTFRHVYSRLFGPAYEGEYNSPPPTSGDGTYVLSYPGLAFTFPVKHRMWSDKADFVSILSSSATSPATSMAIFCGPSWPEVRDSLYTTTEALPRSAGLVGKNADAIPDEVEEVVLRGAGRVEFWRRTGPVTTVKLNETTPQDLVADFGPPDAIYRKNDSRISIHAGHRRPSRRRPSASPGLDPHGVDTDQSSMQSYTDDSEIDSQAAGDDKLSETQSECFYNYFHHGFDALISPPTSKSPAFPGSKESSVAESASVEQVVTKLIFHGNVPGSYSFNRHRRSRWKVVTSSAEDAQAITSEMPFAEVSPVLKRVWHDWYENEQEQKKMQRGMVLNRGWGESPESSIELLGGFEESTPVNSTAGAGEEAAVLNNTELFGFPGMLFEVLKNDAISCLTVY
jgi:Uncharacterised protein family (UPF0183)